MTASSSGPRTMHDSFGDMTVPEGARWGASTQRAVENFPVSGWRVDASVIRALTAIKRECAAENAVLGIVTAEQAEAIGWACDRVIAGEMDDQFPVDVFQTGSGTSTNMNVNEVVAALAEERLGGRIRVHPNDHVNAGQSSNDTFPSAVHLAAALAITREVGPAVSHLVGTLREASVRFADAVKPGRTHLMDAVPVTLGQELGGWARHVEAAGERLQACLPRLCELPLGGTAVGTGLNAPAGFAEAVVRRLASGLGLPLQQAVDHFEAQGAREAMVAASAACRGIALAIARVADDLRWLASGPRTGLGEIRLPALQPGSSIMPGKVNPVVCESVMQVAAHVVGCDAAVSFAAATLGNLDLHVGVPVMAHDLLTAMRLLASASTLLADRAVAGMTVDADRMQRLAAESAAIVTSVAPSIGYDAAAAVVHRSEAEGITVVEALAAQLGIPGEDARAMLDVRAMAQGIGPRTAV